MTATTGSTQAQTAPVDDLEAQGAVAAGLDENATDALARDLGQALQARAWTLATAESCTGGLVAAAVTEVAGSSAWFDRGFVTYSNAAKVEELGVSTQTLAQYGAVSEQTAGEMALGALEAAAVQVGVSTTGIAGPGGAVPGKPVGTVCFGFALRAPQTVGRPTRAGESALRDANGDEDLGVDLPAPVAVVTVTRHFPGDRAAVRRASVDFALSHLLTLLAAH